ncbi:hypothetical protein BS50DRAFT_502737 [Corynespora cassiicola Philippines]|uniref:Uncharacterized protein n=1 Tax=Corynespora cassiicola Philippines TaxID=1448308 RepID=A0A2T2NAC6_CORCC|nr:hypothetical protein BS50DRAFT_502737 [Corynespora cassiicola Philippines]
MHIQKREPERDSRIPPRANFLAAANYMKNLFDGKKFNWAAMGGLALLCLGARRDMFEIQIVYEDRDFNRIKPKLEADQRIRMTETMNSLFTTKLLLATGPQFKDIGCTQSAEIVVYLIPPGKVDRITIRTHH